MLSLVRRVWRGAWKPTYRPSAGWWYFLDIPYRIRDILCALFLFFLGPPWVGYLLYEAVANNQRHLFVGVVALGTVWLLLFVVAFFAGGTSRKTS